MQNTTFVDLKLVCWLCVQRVVSASYVFKMIRATCTHIKKRVSKADLQENLSFTQMIDEIYKAYFDKKTTARELLQRLQDKNKQTMETVSASMMVPYVRYFIRASDATELDIENRERVLEFKSKQAIDPLNTALCNIKVQQKNKPTSGDEDQEEAELEGDIEMESREGEGEQSARVKYGGLVKVWAVPGSSLVEWTVINGDIFDAIPQAHYDFVTIDPPFGWKKFTGDTEWTMEKVRFM